MFPIALETMSIGTLMLVCMYFSTFIFMRVWCMYACMYVYIYASMHAWWMYTCIYVSKYVFMLVNKIYIYTRHYLQMYLLPIQSILTLMNEYRIYLQALEMPGPQATSAMCRWRMSQWLYFMFKSKQSVQCMHLCICSMIIYLLADCIVLMVVVNVIHNCHLSYID